MNRMTTEQFLALPPLPLVLYGASGGGLAASEYLRELGIYDRVECFVDSDKHKQGTLFCDRMVTSPDILSEWKGGVVLSSGFMKEIYETVRNRAYFGPVYCYLSLDPPYAGNEEFDSDPYRMRSIYDTNDTCTMIMLDEVIEYRGNPSLSHIQPYETVKHLSMVGEYWYGSEAIIDEAVTIVDAGAFTGDSLADLIGRYGQRIKQYHAFEPDAETFALLRRCADDFTATAKVDCYNTALGVADGEASLQFGIGGSSHLSDEESGTKVSIRRLDNMNLKVVGAPYIKMDIEGYELDALKGGADFIRQHKPGVAICVYHRANDLTNIPEYLRTLVPEYRFVLRGNMHMVCYGRT